MEEKNSVDAWNRHSKSFRIYVAVFTTEKNRAQRAKEVMFSPGIVCLFVTQQHDFNDIFRKFLKGQGIEKNLELHYKTELPRTRSTFRVFVT